MSFAMSGLTVWLVVAITPRCVRSSTIWRGVASFLSATSRLDLLGEFAHRAAFHKARRFQGLRDRPRRRGHGELFARHQPLRIAFLKFVPLALVALLMAPLGALGFRRDVDRALLCARRQKMD